MLLLRSQFIFRRPNSKDHCINSFVNTIQQHYRPRYYSFQIEKVGSASGIRDCYCEFTGDGDIHIQKMKGDASLSIMNIDLAVPRLNPTESITPV